VESLAVPATGGGVVIAVLEEVVGRSEADGWSEANGVVFEDEAGFASSKSGAKNWWLRLRCRLPSTESGAGGRSLKVPAFALGAAQSRGEG
jgi:hypothetical protein